MYIPKWFSSCEWKCKCGECRGVAATKPLSDNLLVLLDYIRGELQAPIRINSGWRCAKYNKACKGARRSLHLVGRAADITSDSYDSLLYICKGLALKEWRIVELIPYKESKFIHVGVEAD